MAHKITKSGCRRTPPWHPQWPLKQVSYSCGPLAVTNTTVFVKPKQSADNFMLTTLLWPFSSDIKKEPRARLARERIVVAFGHLTTSPSSPPVALSRRLLSRPRGVEASTLHRAPFACTIVGGAGGPPLTGTLFPLDDYSHACWRARTLHSSVLWDRVCVSTSEASPMRFLNPRPLLCYRWRRPQFHSSLLSAAQYNASSVCTHRQP